MLLFRLLVLGNSVSAYGSYLNLVAVNVFVYRTTGSSLAVGAFMALRLAATVVSGFISGELVSRHDRRKIMVAADLLQAAALVGALLTSREARLVALYAFALVTGACATASQTALRSAVPEMVGAAERVGANGLVATGRSIAMVAGFSSAGVLTAAYGYSAALAVDAGTFLVSAAVLSLLPLRTRADRALPGEAGEAGGEETRRTGPGALVLLRAFPVVAVLIAVRGVDGLGSSSHNVALPVYSAIRDAAHPAAFISWFWATWAVGNVVAQQLCRRLALRRGRPPGERAFALGACVMSAAFIAVFSTPSTGPAMGLALLAGMADGFTETVYVSRLQETPDHWRGRVFGLSAVAENTGFGLGMLLSAALLERSSPFAVVGAFHGLAIALCLLLLAWLQRRRRRGGGPVGTGARASYSGRTVRPVLTEGTDA